MNNNIKRIIAMTLIAGTISGVGSTKYTNFFTTAAYASSSDADELTNLELETSSGSSLTLYTDSSYDDKLDDDLSLGDTYYAKASASKIKIESIDGAEDDNVRIFKGSSSTAYEVGDDISISSGTTTTLKVRVYEDEYDSSEDYSSSDYNQYTIVVKNTTSTSDDVDLLGITLNNGVVNFNRDTTSYTVNVPTDATSTIVQATPNDTDNTVKIDGTTVSNSDGYKKTISLTSTTNTVTVKVSNDTDSKTYTLTVNKTLTGGLGQQGGQQQGGQQDNQSGNINGNGFGNNNQGANSIQLGWQKMNGLWYYFNNNGQKKIGWVQDKDRKWYYLNSDGSMAHDTTISGYKVGADGAWIQ